MSFADTLNQAFSSFNILASPTRQGLSAAISHLECTSEVGTVAVPSSHTTVAAFSIGLRIAPGKRYSSCRISKNPFLGFQSDGNGITAEKRRSTAGYEPLSRRRILISSEG